MPHDSDEKPTPAPEAARAPTFDFDDLPRVRPVFMFTPNQRAGEPATQEPATAPSRETGPEFDTDNVPRVRPQFRLRPHDLPGTSAPREPAPVAQKRTGEDWRAATLAQRANESPPRGEKPTGESEAALRAFLDTGEAETENRSAKDDEDQPG